MKTVIQQAWILKEGTSEKEKHSLHKNSDDIYTFSNSFPDYTRVGKVKVLKVSDEKYFQVFKAPLAGIWDD